MFLNPIRNLTARALLNLLVLCPLISSLSPATLSRAASLPARVPGSRGEALRVRNSRQKGTLPQAGMLRPGETVAGEITGGEAHAFRVTLGANQYLRVVVEQQRADIILRLLRPDGSLFIEKDSPNGMFGAESVSVLAEVAGEYTVEVRSEKAMPAGKYEVRIAELRDPTASDLIRAESERVFAEAQSLRSQANPEALKSAVVKYKEALGLWREAGDTHQEAYTLCNIGRVQRSLGSLAESTSFLEQSLSLLRAARDVAGQAFVLNEIGASHRNLGNHLDALEYYQQSLELRRSVGDLWGQAQVLNNIAIIYANTSQQKSAIENYEKALKLWPSAGDAHMEANTLTGLADVYTVLGELSVAFNHHQRVLNFSQSVNNKRLEAFARNNIGKIYDTWGESNSALEHYEAALSLFGELNHAGGQALVLDNIGMVHAALGDAQGALDHFRKALAIRERLKEPRGLAVTLTNIGYAYTIEGDQREALKYFKRALPLSRESNNKQFVAYALVVAGIAYVSLGEPQTALGYYSEALKIQQETDDRRGQAITLDKIGEANAAAGDLTKAVSAYEQALQQWDAVADKQGRALSLYGIAKVERDRNNLDEARRRIDEAIDLVESLRTKTTNQHLRLSYFASKHDYYALSIDVRMRLFALRGAEADRVAAFHTSERARARSFLDLLAEATTSVRKNIRPQLSEKALQLRRDINTHADSLLRLRNQKRLEDAKRVEQRLGELIREYDALEAKIRAGSKSYSDTGHTRPLGLKEIQQLLDTDTLLLEFALGDEHSYAWVITRTTFDSYELPARAEVEKAVAGVREALVAYEPRMRGESATQYLTRLNRAEQQYWSRARSLSHMLIGRLSSRLGAGRLVVVADGALQYLPFHALPPPGAPPYQPATQTSSAAIPATLVLRNEIIYQPSASALALLRKSPARTTRRSVAVLADPVYDSHDERVIAREGKKKTKAPEQHFPRELRRALRDVGDVGDTGQGLKLERLRFSAEEAEGIISFAPTGSWLKATDFKASRSTATSPALSEFSIVHFATHGIFDDKNPELSGLVLSLVDERGNPEDGFLRLHDIHNLNLSADLVVLSACRTGIGKQVKGEGLVGLTRGFMYAGASRVVASLWRVDDEATAELMKRFYWHMLEEKKPAATALRLAQIDIMRAREQWRAPYYWAGFILQGDWK